MPKSSETRYIKAMKMYNICASAIGAWNIVCIEAIKISSWKQINLIMKQKHQISTWTTQPNI